MTDASPIPGRCSVRLTCSISLSAATNKRLLSRESPRALHHDQTYVCKQRGVAYKVEAAIIELGGSACLASRRGLVCLCCCQAHVCKQLKVCCLCACALDVANVDDGVFAVKQGRERSVQLGCHTNKCLIKSTRNVCLDLWDLFVDCITEAKVKVNTRESDSKSITRCRNCLSNQTWSQPRALQQWQAASLTR